MRNIDKIRTMSAEELAEKVAGKGKCAFCIWDDGSCGETVVCRSGISRWLKQEINPMPDLKAGDLLITENDEFYVAITPNKLVTLRSYVIIDLDNALKYTKFTFVKRYIDDGLKEIWRANNGN